MILLILLIAVVTWTVCGVLTYGLTLAYFQQKWPSLAPDGYREDARFARCMAVTGPIGLATALYLGDRRYGLQFRYKELK